jgi:hypothetical protein
MKEELRKAGFTHAIYGERPDPVLSQSRDYANAYVKGERTRRELAISERRA